MEGFPISALEAAATGTLVVCSEESNFGEVIDNWQNGVKVSVNKAEFYRDALIELMENRERLSTFASKSVALAKKFDWKNITQQYETEYGEVLAKTTEPSDFTVTI